MAKATEQKLDHVKYIGPHPSVAVVDVDGEFLRGQPLGPFDEATIDRLCKKKDEFKRCAAPGKKESDPGSDTPAS